MRRSDVLAKKNGHNNKYIGCVKGALRLSKATMLFSGERHTFTGVAVQLSGSQMKQVQDSQVICDNIIIIKLNVETPYYQLNTVSFNLYLFHR